MKLQPYLEEKHRKIDLWLDKLLPTENTRPEEIHKAMRYSIFAGGKRLRPILVIATAEPYEVPEEVVYPIACAFEMIHTYSLIHDDLPAMDNDEMRRGRPTCHKIFGEAIAILAGDALLTRAFEIIATAPMPQSMQERKISIIAELAKAAGTVDALIGGQVVDILSEGQVISEETLDYIHNAKTGAIIRAAARCGGIIAGVPPSDLEKIDIYGKAAGLAFQITDDLLDVLATSQQLGKTAGKDAHTKKATYVSVHGIKQSQLKAQQLCEIACSAARSLSKPSPALEAIAWFFVERSY
ncbi:MAG: polyprenyl synthetase family protein [Acidobacteriota bacterium]|nr:polyprenyl synthetase family protein [Blastocatellia bacterium]MDW8412131.1 polyprenyl synthetase family protein [Acidobacteriota bacterium]